MSNNPAIDNCVQQLHELSEAHHVKNVLIAALEAELAAEKEKHRVEWEAERRACDLLSEQNLAMALELAEARKDSERLKKMYEIADVVSVPYISIRLDLPESAKWDGSTCLWNLEIFNAAIDAAMEPK